MALLYVVLSLCLVSLTVAAPTAHIVFIIGQSNAIGYNTDGHTAEDVTYSNILQTSCCVNGAPDNNQCKLVAGQDPLHHNCDSGYLNSQNVGFGMSFARRLREEVPADDVIVLVPAAIGGTGFVDDVWTAYTGRGFVGAQQRLQATFKLLQSAYPQHTATIDAILWHQGEADADVNTNTTDYLNKDIIPMINAWRDTNVIAQTTKQTPFIVGNLVPSWVENVTQTKRLGVLVALQVLNQYIPYTAVTPSQGLVGDVSEGETTIHFSAKSQRIFGKRYYEAFKAARLNNPNI